MLRIPHRPACSSTPSPLPSCSGQNPGCSSSSSSSTPARFLPYPRKPQPPIPLLFHSHHGRRSHLLSCKASTGSDEDGSLGDDDGQFIQASLLVSETVRHYNYWKQGFAEETKWHLPDQRHPVAPYRKGEKSNISSIGHGFLRKFQSPTIFLKIACDGDMLLPIIVGEIAIDEFIDALRNDQHENFELSQECPDQYQVIQNIVGTLGFEVKVVRITERVVKTYCGDILLGKPTERPSISIDARPSDAINVAFRFKAPIYVSKEIVFKDAIKLIYGRWRGRGSGAETVYDVTLDSAAEGPDPLAEELELIRNMMIAVLEERYEDAAIWRDKSSKHRTRHTL